MAAKAAAPGEYDQRFTIRVQRTRAPREFQRTEWDFRVGAILSMAMRRHRRAHFRPPKTPAASTSSTSPNPHTPPYMIFAEVASSLPRVYRLRQSPPANLRGDGSPYSTKGSLDLQSSDGSRRTEIWFSDRLTGVDERRIGFPFVWRE